MKNSHMEVTIHSKVRSTGGRYESQPYNRPNRTHLKVVIYIQDFLTKSFPPPSNDFSTPSSTNLELDNLVSFPRPEIHPEVSRAEVAKLVDRLMKMPEPVERNTEDFDEIEFQDDSYEKVADKILIEDLS